MKSLPLASLGKAAPALLRRPTLWPTALRQIFILAPAGWYRRWPPLPVPDRDYLAFRMETAYGDESVPPSGDDLVSYLSWCKRQPHLRR